MLCDLWDSISRPSEIKVLLEYRFSAKSQSKTSHQRALANDPSKCKCYYYLNMTSRSFAAVIQELDEELRDAVCLFYLVLRGLDTIEDDMSLNLDRKVELLRNFDTIIYQKGWTFNENGPNEKDRELLVHFDVVIVEFLRLKPEYQKIIAEITRLMGNGMADYATGEHRENTSIATIKGFDLYCHYVAGLVGYGLSDLFAASGLEDPSIADGKNLCNSIGLFLQKTNIIRDYRQDLDDGRQFWPKEIWGQYTDHFDDLIKPDYREQSRACLGAMVLNVLELIPDVLTCLSKIQNQSVFTSCSIPQVMAISTLALVFNNLDVYQRNVKIRKGEAVKLILASTNMDNVIAIFREYLQVISLKNEITDRNFLKISMAIGKIEQWITSNIKPSKSTVASSHQSHSIILPVIVGLLGMVIAYYFRSYIPGTGALNLPEFE